VAASSTRRNGRSGTVNDWLFDHFEETIGRAAPGEERSRKLALSPAPLTDETREHLKRLASHGVFVSDHSGVSRKDYLPALLVDSDGQRRSIWKSSGRSFPSSARAC